MREASYTTLKGAIKYFVSLAKDFEMDDEDIEVIKSCKTIEEVEHKWDDLVDNILHIK